MTNVLLKVWARKAAMKKNAVSGWYKDLPFKIAANIKSNAQKMKRFRGRDFFEYWVLGCEESLHCLHGTRAPCSQAWINRFVVIRGNNENFRWWAFRWKQYRYSQRFYQERNRKDHPIHQAYELPEQNRCSNQFGLPEIGTYAFSIWTVKRI